MKGDGEMTSEDKSLETGGTAIRYVIVARVRGKDRFIGNVFDPVKRTGYTASIGSEKLFPTPELAYEYMKNHVIKGRIWEVHRTTEMKWPVFVEGSGVKK